MDPITVVNFVLCLAIVVIGYWSYRKTKAPMVLYVALAFALFGVSHLVTLLGMAESLTAGLLVIRTMGYLLVLYAFYAVIAAKPAAAAIPKARKK